VIEKRMDKYVASYEQDKREREREREREEMGERQLVRKKRKRLEASSAESLKRLLGLVSRLHQGEMRKAETPDLDDAAIWSEQTLCCRRLQAAWVSGWQQWKMRGGGASGDRRRHSRPKSVFGGKGKHDKA
jgi:hypothetical protein